MQPESDAAAGRRALRSLRHSGRRCRSELRAVSPLHRRSAESLRTRNAEADPLVTRQGDSQASSEPATKSLLAHPGDPLIVRESDVERASHVIDPAKAMWRCRGLRRFVPMFAVILGPPIAYFAYGISPFYIQNGVDPFIYAGYIFEPSDLITRYGYTYYSVRFGLLIPAQIFDAILGAPAGYFGLRWVAVSASVGVLWFWCRRIGARHLGWVAAALVIINPVVIRAVMTVYSDSVGVPYLVAAFPLLLLPGPNKTRLMACASAGVLIGLTVHSNLYLVLPLGAALVLWAAVRLLVDFRQAILESAVVIAMVIVVTIAGVCYYRLRYGDADILQPSIAAARRLGDVIPTDRAPTRQWLNFRPAILLPLVATGLLLTSLIRERLRPEWYEVAALAMTAAIGGVYAQNEFLASGFFLETYYYTSYFVGLTVVILLLALRRILAHSSSPNRSAAIAATAVIAFPYAWRLALDDLRVWSIPTIPAILALTILLIVMRTHAALTTASVMLAMTPLLLTLAEPRNVPLAAGQTYRREPTYERALLDPDDQDLARYELASDFMRVVPDWRASPGTVVFWYRDSDETANLMGSTFLWKETTLTVAPPGLPKLDDAAAQRLSERTPRFLVLVASTEDLADTGLSAVRTAVAPLSNIRTVLRRGSYKIFIEVITLSPSSCDKETRGSEGYFVNLPPCPR